MGNVRKTIVYVDGIQFNLVTLRYILKQQYNVFPAQSIEKLFEILDGYHNCKNANPDLIILDISMPDIGGFNALKALKHNARFKEIPVIVASLKQDNETISEAIELGAAAFIAKPFSDLHLVEHIEYLLNPEPGKVSGRYFRRNHRQLYPGPRLFSQDRSGALKDRSGGRQRTSGAGYDGKNTLLQPYQNR